MTTKRCAELHPFADPSFVTGGFTYFVWAVFDYQLEQGLPVYQPSFGLCVDVTDVAPEPGRHHRYNPSTGQFSSTVLTDDHNPALQPFHNARFVDGSWAVDPV